MTLRHWALLVIDMQRDFLDPRGYVAQSGVDVSLLRVTIEPVQRLLAAARSLGLRVIHTREGHRPDLTDLTPFKWQRTQRSGAAIGSQGPLGRLLVRGEYGHDIVDEVAPWPGEAVVDKPGFGAFYATDLELMLRSGDITHLALAGVTTDICVHTTLREAIDRGFFCTTISDACAAGDPEVHAAMLKCIAGEGNILGQVRDTRAMIEEWQSVTVANATPHRGATP
jgi:nicotinamidase-related amidase